MMLAVIYMIAVIISKELVTATDQCTNVLKLSLRLLSSSVSLVKISTIRIHRTITHQDIIGFLMDPVECSVQLTS